MQLLKLLLSDYPYLSITQKDLKKMSDKDWSKLAQIDSRFYSVQNEMRLKKITK